VRGKQKQKLKAKIKMTDENAKFIAGIFESLRFGAWGLGFKIHPHPSPPTDVV